MSKYTTEVRYICEEAAGLRESQGYNDVNEIVNKAYPHIFDNSLNFYNDETRDRLLPKILLHYYTREIGFETVGLWRLKLNQKMREILPYYNQLYASEDIEYDPLKNVDNTHTHAGSYADGSVTGNVRTNDLHGTTSDVTLTENIGKTNNSETSDNLTSDSNSEARDIRTDGNAQKLSGSTDQRVIDNTVEGSAANQKTTRHGNDVTTSTDKQSTGTNDVTDHTTTSPRDHWVMYSDTPQGGIDGVQLAGGASASGTLSDNAYLTNATHETDAPAVTRDSTGRLSETDKNGSVTEQYGDINESLGEVTNKTDKTTDDLQKQGWDSSDTKNREVGSVLKEGTNRQRGSVLNEGSTNSQGSNVSEGTSSNTGTITDSGNKNDSGVDSYENREFGKIGVMTYQDMVQKYRDTFLNIDMMIIEDLSDLFMKVW